MWSSEGSRDVKHSFRERIDSLSERGARDRKRQCEPADAGEHRFAVLAWIMGRVDGTVRKEGAEAEEHCGGPLVCEMASVTRECQPQCRRHGEQSGFCRDEQM